MNKPKIIRLFSADFKPMERKSFAFRLSANDNKLLAVFFSEDCSVSIAINDTELPFEKIQQSDSSFLDIPPKKRMYRFTQIVNTGIISGSITNLNKVKNNRIINLYAITSNEIK